MLLQLLSAGLMLAHAPDPAARALVDHALERMGGIERFQSIERVRFEFITQWQRTTFRRRPYADRPSYERHTDVRDYTLDAWRNTRRFERGGSTITLIDIVRGDAGVRTIVEGAPGLAPGRTPLNVAYVDERDEIFAWTPDRLLLHAREAADLRLLADTAIDGMPHARIALTLNGAPSVLVLRRTDGLPALLRFRKAHANDFGLAPLGVMDVEVWYSNWTTLPPGVHLPTQIDVRRATRPYKRMTVIEAAINPTFAPDSFALCDSLRSVFLATSTRPMHDVPIDSARTVEDRFVEFRTFGGPAGAVKVGDAWLLLETGQAPLSAERALTWLREQHHVTPAYAIVGTTTLANGGIAHTTRERIPTLVPPGFRELAAQILRGWHAGPHGLDVVERGRWIEVGGDSVRVEPIDLPDAPGALIVWVPALRWLYAPAALTPLDRAIVLEHARTQGWAVQRLGGLRGLTGSIAAS